MGIDKRSAGARPLRIGIDTLFVRPGVNGGAEFFMRELAAALARVDRVNRYFVFVTPRNRHLFSGLGENFRTVVCRYPGGRGEVLQRIAWEWSALRLQARLHRLDVVHFPANLIPAGFPRPTVLTVHDFSSFFYRERLPVKLRPTRRLLDHQRLRSCMRASRLAAISGFTRDETLARTGVDPARLSVVHSAGREFRVPSPDEARRTVARYGVRGPYLLAVSTLNHHKNLVRLLEAFAAVSDVDPPPLVLVGRAGNAADALAEQLKRLDIEDRVIVTGYVPDEDIPAFYRGAELFLFPSLYEGFGLPLLEAATCGTPVLAANAGALPEVGGDAALYFDPLDVEDIAAVLRRALSSPELRRGLAARGPAEAARFTWNDTAARMVALYEEAARG